MGLATAWSETAGLRAPIVNAPMGGLAGGKLAAAVCGARGLGMIGVGSAGSPKTIETEARHASQAGVNFGIGLIDCALRADPAPLEAAIAAQPLLVSVSFGDYWSWADQVRAAGIITATPDLRPRHGTTGRRCRGRDPGRPRSRGSGHDQPSIGTLALLESVLDAVDVPVLAAGRITTGRGLAAVLVAGASGVWLGTAFAACPESLISDQARQALLRASGADTAVTRPFDVARRYPWPAEYPERVLRNDFTNRWSGHEAQLALDHDAHAALAAGIATRDVALAPVNTGQGVDTLVESHSAAHIIEQLPRRVLASAIMASLSRALPFPAALRKVDG